MKKRKEFIRKILISVLSVCLSVCMLSGCSDQKDTNKMSNDKGSSIDEQFVSELFINEEKINEEYIKQNLIIEEGLYELHYNEEIISQAFIIETVVTENSVEEIQAQLPFELDEYDIDWTKVISKFAIGTTIIIAVGVVNAFAKSTYFVFSSAEVAKDALVGGAMAISLNEIIKCYNSGNDNVHKAVKKYSIESFADGYMMGAISSVLKIGTNNFKRLKAFKTASGNKFKINIDGSVLGANGKVVGKAYYDKNNVWHFVDDLSGSVTYFDNKGKEITAYSIKNYANSTVRYGLADDYIKCELDDNGKIFRKDNELLPNIEYVLNDYRYKTDEYGRKVEVHFDELKLKDSSRSRIYIRDSIETISGGEEIGTLHDRSHLIADRFDGDNSLGNMISLPKEVNRGVYKKIEENWASALIEGKKVRGTIYLEYLDDSFIPKSIEFIYNIGYKFYKEIIEVY